ncbi:MAG TPA: hypothetical protein VFT62_00555 [Mycobacteriales bacterium]|nr:hypothetical protein [Mycobacteriales bacterium]
MPDEAPWTDPVVIPDDLRELQPDIDAYHRELRQAARRRRVQRVTGTRAWQRLAWPTLVTTAALALGAVVFAVLTFGQPRSERGPAQQPVAMNAAAASGTVGGLLPNVVVDSALAPVSIRALRPALVALVPLHCGCTQLLSDLAGQASEAQVPLVVVAPAAQDAEVAALAGQLHRGRVVPVFDDTGELARTYAATGVTALVVAPDATVSYIQHGVAPGQHLLELPLQQMVVNSSG